MLTVEHVANIVREAAAANLERTSFEDVMAEPSVDSEGHDGLHITVVLKPNVAAHLSGDAVLDTLLEILKRLNEEGDERFPIIEYATREELEAVGDS